MSEKILEACVDSVESALAAVSGGADRLELCSNLVIGGTTPGRALFREIRKHTNIRIHVLVRPRFGDFCYTEHEINVMKEEIREFRELGAEGVVLGVLKPDGTMNIKKMQELIREADGMWVTLHRAFDVCADPYETMEQAITLGINGILTSGQANNCINGAKLISELVRKSSGRIEMIVGSGVNAEVIETIYPLTKASAFHMSGKVNLDSEMVYRKAEINMGLPGMSEYEIWRTAKDKIRQARNVIDRV